MPDRLRIDDRPQHNWRDFLIVVTSVLAVGTLMLWAKGWWAWARVGRLALAASLIPLGLELFNGFRRRRWITVTPEGFVLHERCGDRTCRDDQVVCLSLLRKEKHLQESLQGVTRTLLVWVETPAGCEQIRMVNYVESGMPDPLGPLIDRLQSRLLTDAREALAAGGVCEGEGWSLTPDQLTIQGREPRTVPLRELAAVAVVDHAVCVWRRSQDEPLVRIALDTANAGLLLNLLGELLPEDTPAPPADSDDRRLGRLLFERRPEWAAKSGLQVLAGCGTTLLALGATMVSVGKLPWPALAAGTAVFGAVCAAWYLFVSGHATLRCHEHGVWCRWFFREERLRYADLTSFRYALVRRFLNGSYIGTNAELEFVAYTPSGQRTIRFKNSFLHSDAELERLCGTVSRVIAAGMLRDWQAGQPVPWTSRLRFLPEGLEYAPGGWLVRREPQVIPYDEIVRTEIRDGTFSLWRTGREKPAATESVNERNFYPGHTLLTTCFDPTRADEEARPEGPAVAGPQTERTASAFAGTPAEMAEAM